MFPLIGITSFLIDLGSLVYQHDNMHPLPLEQC
jgi:hypothetical protein